MVELGDEQRVLGVDGIGKTAQAGNDGGIEQRDERGPARIARVDAQRLDHDGARAALGDGAIVHDHPLADAAALGEIGDGGQPHDSILGGARADADRLEETREAHGSPSHRGGSRPRGAGIIAGGRGPCQRGAMR